MRKTVKRGTKAATKKSDLKKGQSKSALIRRHPKPRYTTLFRPDRSDYIKRKTHVEGLCVFCKARDGDYDLESLKVYESAHAMVVLNKYPYNAGHLLVIPKLHGGDIVRLSRDHATDLMLTLQLAMKALNDVYQPQAINCGMNHGVEAGAGIPEHLHFHVIPRWSGDTNFFPLIADTKCVIESLEQTFTKVKRYFDAISKK